MHNVSGRAKGKHMKNDPWNGKNPEDDPIFQSKIQAYRTEQALERELAHEEITQRFNDWASQPRIDLTHGLSVLLCAICARSLPSRKANVLVCTYCQTWDVLLGNLFEAEGFLGLDGQTFLSRSHNLPEKMREAAIEGVFATINNWLSLYDWQHAEVWNLAQDAGWEHQLFVTLSDWQTEFPGTPNTSLNAYIRLLDARHAWITEVAPEALRATWYLQQWSQYQNQWTGTERPQF
jgi:hypothetical protein